MEAPERYEDLSIEYSLVTRQVRDCVVIISESALFPYPGDSEIL